MQSVRIEICESGVKMLWLAITLAPEKPAQASDQSHHLIEPWRAHSTRAGKT